MADPTRTDPDLYRVVLENERVRVLRYHDGPGDRTHAHEHPDSVMITLSAFDRRLVQGDQQVDVHLPAGEVRWLDAQEHRGENVGDTDTVVMFVELKEPATTPATPRLGPVGQVPGAPPTLRAGRGA
ncbi:MAG: hypothetical protein MUF35_05760 [Candidatus Nanopelagicales bacterium]|jgi:quercetin dioxygenase-like cupin family protein|nr:hypothetical protein [Candidatus Nanopelagicales bacterium]